ncbi:hypothetical protein CEXT_729181 [Caerostris extrusa]|uniref:Uncharacterized protein n=1 Tax=Caerostris extrusa TaxID=172846 RepID=A0AAV4PFC7_CAEEX|nr:hypothetical protein CEXT_729181 [Caerostris extrusa]
MYTWKRFESTRDEEHSRRDAADGRRVQGEQVASLCGRCTAALPLKRALPPRQAPITFRGGSLQKPTLSIEEKEVFNVK